MLYDSATYNMTDLYNKPVFDCTTSSPNHYLLYTRTLSRDFSLNKAISLLQELAEQCGSLPMTPLHEALFKILCTALWTRFIHTANEDDRRKALEGHTAYTRVRVRLGRTKV